MQDRVGAEQEHEHRLGKQAKETGLNTQPSRGVSVRELGKAQELKVHDLVLVAVLVPKLVEAVGLAPNHGREMRHEAANEPEHASSRANVEQDGQIEARLGYGKLQVDPPMPEVPSGLQKRHEAFERREGFTKKGREELNDT